MTLPICRQGHILNVARTQHRCVGQRGGGERAPPPEDTHAHLDAPRTQPHAAMSGTGVGRSAAAARSHTARSVYPSVYPPSVSFLT